MKHFPDVSNVCIDIISNFDLAAVISAMIAISASIYIFRMSLGIITGIEMLPLAK